MAKPKDRQIEDLLRRARSDWGQGWGMLSREQQVMAIKAAAFDWLNMADAFRVNAEGLMEHGLPREDLSVLKALAKDSDGLRDMISRVCAQIERIEGGA